MSRWHGGKGSKRRKQDDQQAYEDGWERIFGKKDKNDKPTKDTTRPSKD